MFDREKLKEFREKRLDWQGVDKAVSAFHHWKGNTVLPQSRTYGDDSAKARYEAFERCLDGVNEVDLRAAYEKSGQDVYIALIGLKRSRDKQLQWDKSRDGMDERER